MLLDVNDEVGMSFVNEFGVVVCFVKIDVMSEVDG